MIGQPFVESPLSSENAIYPKLQYSQVKNGSAKPTG
jgi:hypothetical protein